LLLRAHCKQAGGSWSSTKPYHERYLPLSLPAHVEPFTVPTSRDIERSQRRRRSVATPFLCCGSPFCRDNDHSLLGAQTSPTQVVPTIYIRKRTSLYNLIGTYPRHHTLVTMARTSGRTLSGLVAALFIFLLVAPVRAGWDEAYCSQQNTGSTDVCKFYLIILLVPPANTRQTLRTSCQTAIAQITAETKAHMHSPSSNTRIAIVRI
jgi:hypothetical protein